LVKYPSSISSLFFFFVEQGEEQGACHFVSASTSLIPLMRRAAFLLKFFARKNIRLKQGEDSGCDFSRR